MIVSRVPMFLDNAPATSGDTSAPATSTVVAPPGQSSGSPLTADDIFSRAAEELSEDLPDEEVPADDEGTDDSDTPVVKKEAPADDPAKLSEASELPLYVFEGKVMGKDLAIEIKTKKDLDKLISQGAAAKHVIPEFKRLREENAVLKTKADRADVFDKLVTTQPKEFLDNVSDSLDEDTLADWVFEKFHYFKKLAAMTEEDRTKERSLLAANKLLRERDQQLKESEEIKKRNHVAAVDLEVKRLKSWREESKSKYGSKIDAQWHPWVDQQIKNVMMNYKSQLKDGESVNLTRMSRLLDDTLAPLLASIPKKNVDKTVRKTLDDKSNTATRELQNLARTQSSGNSSPKKPMTSNDIWGGIAAAIDSGQLKLES